VSLDFFVAGHYRGTYAGVSVGDTKGGFELDFSLKGQAIDQSDAYGETLLDYVYRGGDCRITFNCLAYKPGSLNPFSPWSVLGTLGPIGKLGSDHAVPLVLSAAVGTTASNAPASLTGPKAITPPNWTGKLLYHSVLREVPVQLAFLPYAAGSGVQWFTQA